MKLIICTGWSPQGWEEYGRRFLESFAEYWPVDVQLEICGEREAISRTSGAASALAYADRLPHKVNLTALNGIRGCMEFIERHQGNPRACGRERIDGHNWKERAVVAGYNWRYDAVKFSRQGFIPHYVAARLENRDADFLCWLDGDVVSHARVPSASTITNLLPAGKAIAYLGREPKHPDIAFQLYNLRHPRSIEFLREFRAMYETDCVFSLKEWHSAFAWHHILRRPQFLEVAHNLTPQGSGHVWHQSPLRFWGDHLKGERKKHARSPERR
jgi:hypothetical protein